MVKFTWKMQNRLNRKQNQISDFPDFVFQVMVILVIFVLKTVNFRSIFMMTRKIKIGKIWNSAFLFIQPIPDLSCKFDHFWKKMDFDPTNFWFWSLRIKHQNKIIFQNTWKIWNRLNKNKKQISDFSDFYFYELCSFLF